MTHPTYPHGGPGSFVLVGHRVATPDGRKGTVANVYPRGVTLRIDGTRDLADYRPDDLDQLPERPDRQWVPA